MDLHHAGNAGEWTTVPANKRNAWQRLAAQTRGIVTPANAVSVLGGAVGAVGLVLMSNGQGKLGVCLLIAGRLADIADGFIAHITGTKSPLGEALDATIDKVMCGGVLLVFAVEGWLPLWVLVLLALHTIINSVFGLIGNIRKLGLHPTRTGKTGATLVWAGLIGFGILQVTSGGWHTALTFLTWTNTGAALLLSYASSFQYGKRIVGKRP